MYVIFTHDWEEKKRMNNLIRIFGVEIFYASIEYSRSIAFAIHQFDFRLRIIRIIVIAVF